MGEDDKKYQVYLDERYRATKWEYSETDKYEDRQYWTCITIIVVSVAIIFYCGDSLKLGILAATSSISSLIALNWSSACSQDVFRFYRDSLINPEMEFEEKSIETYNTKRSGVTRLNNASTWLYIASLLALVLRLIQQVAS